MAVVSLAPAEQKARSNRFDAQVSVNLGREELLELKLLVEHHGGETVEALCLKLDAALDAGRRMGKW